MPSRANASLLLLQDHGWSERRSYVSMPSRANASLLRKDQKEEWSSDRFHRVNALTG